MKSVLIKYFIDYYGDDIRKDEVKEDIPLFMLNGLDRIGDEVKEDI